MCDRDDDDNVINDDNDGDYDDDGDGGHTGVHPTTPHMGRQSSLSLVNSRSPLSPTRKYIHCVSLSMCVCVWPVPVYIQGVFLLFLRIYSTNQSEILLHEILDVQKILVG